MDGWGIGPPWGGNAILQARTQNMDTWWRSYAHTTLLASGEAVGLPPNTAGNSETGHLNIGAGRVVPQDVGFINGKITDGSFFKNPKILAAFEHVKKNKSALHLMGLAGAGQVHSDINHLYQLMKMAKENTVPEVYMDLFTDGRDSGPQTALTVIDDVNRKIKEVGIGRINSICGRYFAMDRDKNWGRTSRAYNALTKGEANVSLSAREAISHSYLHNINDEFIEPSLIDGTGAGKKLITDNDAIIFFNFRPDRARQLASAFSGKPIPELNDRKILKNLYFLTFINREPDPTGIPAFEAQRIKNCLGEVVSNQKLAQFHIAETEKYAHVSYFIDGGREIPFPLESRMMIPSPKVSTYDLSPAMSAKVITDEIMKYENNFSLIVCNYANADMVGHAGNFYAAVQAVESVDECLGRLVKSLLIYNYSVIITADHGNAEELINPKTNLPDTEHTTNPVPFVIISKEIEIARARLAAGGALANIAPTILQIMGIAKPPEMTAASLFGGQNGGS